MQKDLTPSNQLSFMLYKLVFLFCHSQFASYPYTSASYSHSGKILQPYVAVTVRMHSDAIFSAIGASRMKTSSKINTRQQIVVLHKQLSVLTHQTDTRESTLRATSHLCVKRERLLITAYSLYSENIMQFHFYLSHVSDEEQRCSR